MTIDQNQNVFQIYSNPAKNVEHLTLQGNLKPSKSIQLNEVFPSLRQLTLKSIRVFDPSIFNVNFPYLNNVTIKYQPMVIEKIKFTNDGKMIYSSDEASRGVLSNAKKSVENLFEKNHQITSVVLDHCSSDYVYSVVNKLPNLKTFNTSYLS